MKQDFFPNFRVKKVEILLKMSSSGIALASLLPAPSQPTWDRDEERAKEMAKEKESDDRRIASFEKTAPPYGARLERPESAPA